MGNLLQRTLVGALGGLAATVAMSAAMAGAHAVGLLGKPPPKKITERLMRSLGVVPRGAKVDVASWIAHFAFGAGAGALFGVSRGLTRSAPAPLAGAIYGALVWATSYAGYLPALGLMPRPSRDRVARQPTMIAAHLIYGGVLGAAVQRAEEQETPSAG